MSIESYHPSENRESQEKQKGRVNRESGKAKLEKLRRRAFLFRKAEKNASSLFSIPHLEIPLTSEGRQAESSFGIREIPLMIWNSYNEHLTGNIPPLAPLEPHEVPFRRKLEQRFSHNFEQNKADYERYITGTYETRHPRRERLQNIDNHFREAKSYIKENWKFLGDKVKEDYQTLVALAKKYREGTRGTYTDGDKQYDINKYESESLYKAITERVMGMKEQLENVLWPLRANDTKIKICEAHAAFLEKYHLNNFPDLATVFNRLRREVYQAISLIDENDKENRDQRLEYFHGLYKDIPQEISNWIVSLGPETTWNDSDRSYKNIVDKIQARIKIINPPENDLSPENSGSSFVKEVEILGQPHVRENPVVDEDIERLIEVIREADRNIQRNNIPDQPNIRNASDIETDRYNLMKQYKRKLKEIPQKGDETRATFIQELKGYLTNLQHLEKELGIYDEITSEEEESI